MCPGLKTGSREPVYAEKLVALIVEMAQMETNIILQLLNTEKPIIYEQQYPDKPIVLSNNQFSVYYHAHEKNLFSDDEHGHFHFFLTPLQCEESHPQHLVALSIDHYGQPRAWFTVNQWVTAGANYDSYQFNAIMEKVDTDEEGTLLQNWLMAMLLFYQQDIGQLMNTSRESLQAYENKLSGSGVPVLENRELYFLCETRIDLGYDLANSARNDI
jgi:hypothetical protein